MTASTRMAVNRATVPVERVGDGLPYISFTVPGTPPTVNHYVKHTRSGRHYKTAEALRFEWDVKLAANGSALEADWYKVDLIVYLGKGQKGDCDNFNKCVLDSLVLCGVIDSDAKIVDLRTRKSRDWENPRTEITVVAYKQEA